MKRSIAAAFVLCAAYALFAERPAKADVGSCYSVQPVCMQGRPACVCDYAMNCYWSCR